MKKLVKSQELQYANEIFVKIVKLLEALAELMGIPRMLSKPDKSWSLSLWAVFPPHNAQQSSVEHWRFLLPIEHFW